MELTEVVTLLDKMQEDNDTGPLYSTLSTTTAKKKKQVLKFQRTYLH